MSSAVFAPPPMTSAVFYRSMIQAFTVNRPRAVHADASTKNKINKVPNFLIRLW
jgi:hypothetical protein